MNVGFQWSVSYCYDATSVHWEIEGTDDTQGRENFKEGGFEIDLEWKAISKHPGFLKNCRDNHNCSMVPMR